MPDWDYKALAFFLSLVNTLGLIAAVIHTNITNRQKVNAAAIELLDAKVSDEINNIDDRLIRVEKGIEHLPTHKDISAIHRRVDEVAQEMRKIEGTMGQVNHSVQMIHQHLLEQSKS